GYVHAWEALTAGRACLPWRDVRSCQASSDATTMGHEPSYDNYCHIMIASTGREKAMRIRRREAPACKSRGPRRIGWPCSSRLSRVRMQYPGYHQVIGGVGYGQTRWESGADQRWRPGTRGSRSEAVCPRRRPSRLGGCPG